MTTERNFYRRGKPAQFIIRTTAFIGQVKGGLGKIIFLANGLQNIIVQPVFRIASLPKPPDIAVAQAQVKS